MIGGFFMFAVIAIAVVFVVFHYRHQTNPVYRRRELQMELARRRQEVAHLEEQVDDLMAAEQKGAAL